MGEGFIVRRGGGGQQTVKPIYNSLTEVGFTSLTLNVTNDSGSIAALYYSVVNTEPAPNQVGTFETEFIGKETKNITITGLTANTNYTVYIKAIAIGEFPSETVIVPGIATGRAITATGGTTNEYVENNKRYKTHRFNSNGTFQITQLSNVAALNNINYFIVAGGGAGGAHVGGGGGAGGLLTGTIVGQQISYGITVGGGGTATGANTQGNNGANSTAFNLTAIGGGGGGTYGGLGNPAGKAGGSGGGGGGTEGSQTGPGGSNTVGQGFAGGSVGPRSGQTNTSGAGGGGAGGAALNRTNAFDNVRRDGADGVTNNWLGTTYWFAGGGGSGTFQSVAAGNGGKGGGGGGSSTASTAGLGDTNSINNAGNGVTSSTSNSFGGVGALNSGGGSGGGGGGSGASSTANGGSGIVLIRYEIAPTT